MKYRLMCTATSIVGSMLISTANAQYAGSGVNASGLQPWMNIDVGEAWKQGYKGAGSTIIIVDDFRSSTFMKGKLGSSNESLRHGQWTLKESSLIAPSAKVVSHDFYSGAALRLAPTGLNVVNLSYTMYARSGLSASQISWRNQEQSIINAAKNGLAVVSKAAGNDGVGIGTPSKSGYVDYLNVALRGAPGAIYVGALSSNGSTSAKASMASYSNIAGSDMIVQKQFLVVGVESSKTGLRGTSFAAPVVSGYAAILGSKFKNASAVTITNQLLTTARTDTIANYDPNVHGRGEASLSRALAPVSIK